MYKQNQGNQDQKGSNKLGKKNFVTKNSDKGLITQIYKELNQLYKKIKPPPNWEIGKGHEKAIFRERNQNYVKVL